MIDITYDPSKDQENIIKHGVSLGMATVLEWSEVVAYVDTRRDYREVREVGLGLIAERLYCVAFTQPTPAVMPVVSLFQYTSFPMTP